MHGIANSRFCTSVCISLREPFSVRRCPRQALSGFGGRPGASQDPSLPPFLCIPSFLYSFYILRHVCANMWLNCSQVSFAVPMGYTVLASAAASLTFFPREHRAFAAETGSTRDTPETISTHSFCIQILAISSKGQIYVYCTGTCSIHDTTPNNLFNSAQDWVSEG